MGRYKKSDLEDFQNWMIEEQGYARSSASSYACNVRRILRLLGAPPSREGLDRVLSTEPLASYPSLFRSTWKRFSIYCQARGLEIPTPTPAATTAVEAYVIPDQIADHLNYMLSTTTLTYKQLIKLRYEHIDTKPSRGGTWIRVPGTKGDYIQVTHPEVVPRILAWAHPDGPKEESPLVPAHPGDLKPMPERPLRRLLAARRRTRRQHSSV